ncbi:hypothetical protein [Rhodopirellula europaea]|uniref:hypothetical protein n=1 Tax=Rhodopirellula europaea TaxID=1263866 RepID=UPI003D2DEE25|tara:strand:- start:10691 stop:10993 length:303 start_codon:yes stop_codon:yes gene_type:complete
MSVATKPFAVDMPDPTGTEPIGLRLLALCWSDLQTLPPELSEAEAAAELKKRLRAAIESELDSLEFCVEKLESGDPYFDEAGKAEFWLSRRLKWREPIAN